MMDIIFNYLKDAILGSAGKVLSYLSGASVDLFSNILVTNVLALFDYLGYILLAIGTLFAIANVCITYHETGAIEVHLMIVNIIKAIIAIIFLQVGTIQLYELSNTLNSLVSQIVSTTDYNATVDNISSTLNNSQLGAMWIFLLALFALGAIIVCLLQIMKRGGMYMAQIIIGYLYIFSIPSGNTQGFFEWCRQTVAIALTNVVQTALLFIGMNLMAKDITKIFLGVGVILAASAVEKIAGRYGMSTNMSNHRPNLNYGLNNMASSIPSAPSGGGASYGGTTYAGAGASSVKSLVA